MISILHFPGVIYHLHTGYSGRNEGVEREFVWEKLFSVFAKKSNHCAMIATLTYLCTHIFKKTETKLNLRWKYTKLAKTNSFE